jgi:hypothetical protein
MIWPVAFGFLAEASFDRARGFTSGSWALWAGKVISDPLFRVVTFLPVLNCGDLYKARKDPRQGINNC